MPVARISISIDKAMKPMFSPDVKTFVPRFHFVSEVPPVAVASSCISLDFVDFSVAVCHLSSPTNHVFVYPGTTHYGDETMGNEHTSRIVQAPSIETNQGKLARPPIARL